MDIEIKELIGKVNEGVVALQSKVDGKVDEAKLEKIVEQVTKAGAELQALNLKQNAIEAAMNRIDQRGEKTGAKNEVVEASKAAYKNFLRTGEIADAKFAVKKTNGHPTIEIKAMQTDVNPEGGYLILPELADFVVDRVFETSPIRALARVVQTGSNELMVDIDDNEAAARWVGEGASGGETSTPQVGKLSIKTHKIEAEPKATTEMLEDSYVDIEAWLREKVSDKFSRTENTAFVNGDGVAKPRGFMTLSAWAAAGTYERNKIEQVNLGNASAFTSDGLIALQASLKEPYQPRAAFLSKRASYGAILALKGADNYFFGSMLLKDGQQQLQLLGKPLYFADDMPAVASNALAIAYGDFSRAYTIVDRVGIQMIRDPYTAKGFVKFYTTKRVGGEVTNFDAIKIGKIAS
jgi:HK97 family phage major capsid protein